MSGGIFREFGLENFRTMGVKEGLEFNELQGIRLEKVEYYLKSGERITGITMAYGSGLNTFLRVKRSYSREMIGQSASSLVTGN